MSAARTYACQTAITGTLMRELLPPSLHSVHGVEFAGTYRPSGGSPRHRGLRGRRMARAARPPAGGGAARPGLDGVGRLLDVTGTTDFFVLAADVASAMEVPAAMTDR